MGIKIRNIEATKTNGLQRYWGIVGSHLGLYGYNDVYQRSGVVLVVKGEKAKLVVEAKGFLSCAISMGESGSGEHNGEIKVITKALDRAEIIVVGDNDVNPKTDEKMKTAAHKRAVLLGARLHFPPPPYGIDDWLLSDPEAINNIRRWISDAGNE